MSKYYTPSISEFRVEFEYELLAKESRYNKNWRFNTVVNVWLHKTFTKADFEMGRGWDRYQDLDEEWIRVKYLDQQDIESCGFELASEDSDDLYFKGKKTLGPSSSGDNWIEIELSKEEQYLYVGRAWGRGKPDILFDGKIKNLSELRQVLTMISVKYIKV